jgi:hypothetical protein
MAGSSSEAPRPPMIAQKITMTVRLCATVIASAPTAYPSRPSTYARFRPNRSPSLLLIRMNAAETSASSAIALWTALTVVSRSSTTDAIETFISDVSTTSTNIAAASRNGSRRLGAGCAGEVMRNRTNRPARPHHPHGMTDPPDLGGLAPSNSNAYRRPPWTTSRLQPGGPAWRMRCGC